MKINAYDFEKILELFEEGRWSEVHIEIGGMHLFLSTDPSARLITSSESQDQVLSQNKGVTADSGLSSTIKADKPLDNENDVVDSVPENWMPVSSPNLGTFYRSPKPGAEPFVEIGVRVEEDAEICLIEVMKLFTTLKAGVKGTIRQVCVEDGEMVEAGQTLFYIEQE